MTIPPANRSTLRIPQPVFAYDAQVRAAVPSLQSISTAVTIAAELDLDLAPALARHHRAALDRLTRERESSWPPIAARRRVLAGMGVRPTQYRCASESGTDDLARLTELLDDSLPMIAAHVSPWKEEQP